MAVMGIRWLDQLENILAPYPMAYPAVVLANNSSNRQSHFMVQAPPVREIGTAEDQRRSPRPGEHW